MPYIYFDDDDQLHYTYDLVDLPESMFGDTAPIVPIAPDDGGDWTLDNVLVALDEEDSDE